MEWITVRTKEFEACINLNHVTHVKRYESGEVCLFVTLHGAMTVLEPKDAERIWSIFQKRAVTEKRSIPPPHEPRPL
jgi:hypothetical protein